MKSTDYKIPNPGKRVTKVLQERLKRSAENVDQNDINELDATLPGKLREVGELKESVQWLEKIVNQVKTLYAMITDKEFAIAPKNKLMIGAGLLYFVLPPDLIPDFIPGVGYIDDAFVLGIVWNIVKDQIDEYTAQKQGVRPASSVSGAVAVDDYMG